MDQFLLLGDSITQQSFTPSLPFSFGAALSSAYVRKLDVVNRGLSGYNTSQALSLLPRLLPHPSQARLRFLIIFFGANDARLPDIPNAGPDQSVPLKRYKANLVAILRHAAVRAHPNVRILLITPPPIDERRLHLSDRTKYPSLPKDMLRRTAENTARYARAVVEVGREQGVTVVDLWTAMITRCGWDASSSAVAALPGAMAAAPNSILESFLLDGLHFSGEGYRVLFDEVMAVISNKWPEQMPERLEMVVPAWDDVKAWSEVVERERR